MSSPDVSGYSPLGILWNSFLNSFRGTSWSQWEQVSTRQYFNRQTWKKTQINFSFFFRFVFFFSLPRLVLCRYHHYWLPNMRSTDITIIRWAEKKPLFSFRGQIILYVLHLALEALGKKNTTLTGFILQSLPLICLQTGSDACVLSAGFVLVAFKM